MRQTKDSPKAVLLCSDFRMEMTGNIIEIIYSNDVVLTYQGVTDRPNVIAINTMLLKKEPLINGIIANDVEDSRLTSMKLQPGRFDPEKTQAIEAVQKKADAAEDRILDSLGNYDQTLFKNRKMSDKFRLLLEAESSTVKHEI